jgi:hypothetical protein
MCQKKNAFMAGKSSTPLRFNAILTTVLENTPEHVTNYFGRDIAGGRSTEEETNIPQVLIRFDIVSAARLRSE